MKNFGASLLFLCLGVIAVDIIGYESMLLSSLYDLGVDVAWCIVAAIIIPGSVLFLFGDDLARGPADSAAK